MPMKTRRVKIADIQIPDVRVTSQYDDETRAELESSMESEGQYEPIGLVEKDNVLILANGLNRIRAAMARGEEYIDAVIRQGDMADVMVQNLATAYLRGKTLISEEVQVIEALTHEYELDSIEIAKRTGMSQARIEQIQWAMTAGTAVREALDDGAISLGAAAELARYLSADQQEQLLPHLLANRWNLKTLHEYVEAVLQRQEELDQVVTTAVPLQQTQALATCYSCSEPWDPRKLSAVMICPSCIGLLEDILRRQRALAAAEA